MRGKVCICTTLVIAILMISMPKLAEGSQDADCSLPNCLETEQMAYLERYGPEVISEQEIEENRHIARLESEEPDENTLVFLNADDTATLYYFDESVKYEDAKGTIKDKSNQLYSAFAEAEYSDYAYVNLDNDIRTYFPKQLSRNQGIVLDSGIGKIELSPYANTVSKVTKTDGENREADIINYESVFGKNAHLQYSTTFQGFKEEIVLENADAGNTFPFIIKSEQFTPVCQDNRLYFMDENNESVIESEPLYVYDSYTGKDQDAHSTENCELTLRKISEEEYLICITVDEAYLKSEDTVYPVYVDPSFTVTTSGSGTTKTIQDVPIYSGSGAKGIASGSNTWNLLGYVGTVNGVAYGTGRLLMKFPGLLNNSTYKTLNANSIKKVTLSFYEGSGKSNSTTIYAYQYTGNTWTETAATYNNSSWSGYQTPSANVTIANSSETLVTIDITNIVKGWKSNSSNAAKGILLKNANESSLSYRKDMRSTESSKKPYLSVTYVYYGCWPFNAENSTKINCLEYACFTGDKPSLLSDADRKDCYDRTKSVEETLEIVKASMKKWLGANFSGTYKEVSGPNVTLSNNQWMIVMRIGKWTVRGSEVDFDYHFWYRTNTGVWANKHGEKPSVLLPPSDQPTTQYSSGWVGLRDQQAFYNSEIVYYVLTK